MADISKITVDNVNYDIKDASAPLRQFSNYSKTGTLPITSSDNTQTAIGKLENAVNANQTNILSVEDMITDKEFDSTQSYSIGDVVTYEHKLYKFKSAHSGAWSTSDVDQITVIAYVDDHSGGGGGAVSGVKGNAESTFRTGDVNLTCDNIGASPNDHSHGSIGRNGDISDDVTIGNNDKLLIKDYSDSNRIKTSSVSFDGATSSQCLTKAGTWASFNNYTHPSDGASGYYGQSTNISPGVGGTFSDPYIHVNSKGHVDAAITRTITLPSNATTSSSGFMSYSDKTMVDNLGGQSISAANFNNLKTPGCYWIPSSGSSNMPWKNGEKVHLLVYQPDPSSTQNIVQIARAINYPKQMFIRTCYSGTWTSWFKFEGTEVT